MGTETNPGEFDCYAASDPDEPVFVLLGRDSFAPALVRLWATLRRAADDDPAKVAEAERCADEMSAWLRRIDRREWRCGPAWGKPPITPPLEWLKGREKRKTP